MSNSLSACAYIGDCFSPWAYESRIKSVAMRSLHPLLEGLNASLAGNHAFRRFRTTHLRKNFVAKDLEHFWLGHADEEVGDLYSKLKDDVEYRKDVAERIGVGFNVPVRLNVNRNAVACLLSKSAELNLVEPKIRLDESVEVAVSS